MALDCTHLALLASPAPVPIVSVVYTFLFSLFVISLTGYHTFLLLTNHTTLEHLKRNFKGFHRRSVYASHSRCSNFARRLCYGWLPLPTHIVRSMNPIL